MSNLTQQELAQYTGVSQTLVSMWELGLDSPSEARRRIMDRVLREKVDWVQEFEPLDPTEQYALIQFAKKMQGEIGEEIAIKLVTRSSKYDLRRMLKGGGYLPAAHVPASVTEPPMPDLDMLMAQKAKEEEETKR
jgi:transcriptional regulator with XRE-family HTH domain